jgi:hypothetical protein
MVRKPFSTTFCSSSELIFSRMLPSSGQEDATYNRTHQTFHCCHDNTLNNGNVLCNSYCTSQQ